MMHDDGGTHDWLSDQQVATAAETQTEVVRVEGEETHERAIQAEAVLHKRSTRYDRGFVTFVVLVGLLVGLVIAEQHYTDRRVSKSQTRSAATTSAVIAAMDAQKVSSQATVLLLTDFADLLTAPTVDAQKAVLAKIQTDTKAVEDAQAKANDALAKAEKLQDGTGT